jgi:copper resistance protein B
MTRTVNIPVVLLLAGLLLTMSSSAAMAQTDPHAGHRQPQPATEAEAQKDGQKPDPKSDNNTPLPSFIPPLTDEDRKVAFQDLKGHAVHDRAVNYFVLLDQFEWQNGAGFNGLSIDTRGWVGRDRDRLWFRAEGDGADGRVKEAQTHLLYGRAISRYWDVVGGIRQDFRPGPAQTQAAFGVQGLAPYAFDIAATAYIGASGRSHVRFEVEYELLLTNRLIAQPLFETEIFGKSDPERGVGAGLSTTDLGVRLRYEFKREFAPYVGITWKNSWGKTADFAKAAGEETGGARLVTGLRVWF